MTPQGRTMLMEDEGCELVAYPDPISHGAPWTAGYGHTGPEVHPGYTMTLTQAEGALDADIAKAESGLSKALPWLSGLDPVRTDVLVNMAFNMGVDGLLKFHNTLAAVQAGGWKAAAAGMLDSAWSRQVQGRAYRLAAIMQSGQYPA